MKAGYTAQAAVAAELDTVGRTRVTRLRSDGPLALRESGGAVYLIGASAGPLGGDHLELDIDVGPGAQLAVRSAAATLILPGRPGSGERQISLFTVRARVASGGRLDFAPEPAIAAAGCDHQALAKVTLAADAHLSWREELILGRHGEPPGRYTSRFDIASGTVPLLRHELRIDETATSCAVLGAAKAIGMVMLSGHRADPYARDGVTVMPLAGPGTLITALAHDAAELRTRLSHCVV